MYLSLLSPNNSSVYSYNLFHEGPALPSRFCLPVQSTPKLILLSACIVKTQVKVITKDMVYAAY